MKSLTLSNPIHITRNPNRISEPLRYAKENDKLTIVKQRRYVYFSVFIDNTGNDFQIEIKELKAFLR